MTALLIGYARCSTDAQDLTAQREGLTRLGVGEERIYVDHGLTGTNRARPGVREALAACCACDTLVVTKLDRLARSLPDALAIADELTVRHRGGATAAGFIEAVGAHTAVIGAGLDNDYGHPHPDVLADLVGSRVLRTDTGGSTTVQLR